MPHDQDQFAITYDFKVRKLPKKGQVIKYSADEAERAAIADEYDLLAVASFDVECLVKPWKGELCSTGCSGGAGVLASGKLAGSSG